MDAIVLAGGTPGPDSPLYPQTRGRPKALLEIGGKALLQWVLDALESASTIDRIVIIGSEALRHKTRSSKVVEYKPAAGDIVANFHLGADAVIKHNPRAKAVALVSSDIPLITPESIDWIVKESQKSDLDLNYPVIDKHLIQSRFPGSARSFVKLKDIHVCGGDLIVINMELYSSRDDLWKKIIDARKSYLQQAALIGVDILFLLMLRQLSLEGAVKKVTRRLDISGQALICPYPEIGMDIDKPHQLELARQALS